MSYSQSLTRPSRSGSPALDDLGGDEVAASESSSSSSSSNASSSSSSGPSESLPALDGGSLYNGQRKSGVSFFGSLVHSFSAPSLSDSDRGKKVQDLERKITNHKSQLAVISKGLEQNKAILDALKARSRSAGPASTPPPIPRSSSELADEKSSFIGNFAKRFKKSKSETRGSQSLLTGLLSADHLSSYGATPDEKHQGRGAMVAENESENAATLAAERRQRELLLQQQADQQAALVSAEADLAQVISQPGAGAGRRLSQPDPAPAISGAAVQPDGRRGRERKGPDGKEVKIRERVPPGKGGQEGKRNKNRKVSAAGRTSRQN